MYYIASYNTLVHVYKPETPLSFIKKIQHEVKVK